MLFSQKKVIVTGGNRGIGKDIALGFAAEGADVLISYCSHQDAAEETIQELNQKNKENKAHAVYADFSAVEDVVVFSEKAVERLGHIDILINNAGITARERLLDLSPETMQQLFQINTISPLYLLQLVAKHMIAQERPGCLINISSIAGLCTFPKGIGYAASKAAINKITQNAALDLSHYNIRVNAVAPGVINAGMNENESIKNPEQWHQRTKDIPLKRPGTAADIVNMVLFLASEKANWITGKIFEVDGGTVL
jgi:NAD(P)-dependent dehydrogenase (short-subunit alcohol dehydrogenase family)